MNALPFIGGILVLAGVGFGFIGAVGVLRFPDFFTRLHAAGITDTMCVMLVLAGLMFHADGVLTVVKLLLIMFFLLFTTPTASHALAKAALYGGQKPYLDD